MGTALFLIFFLIVLWIAYRGSRAKQLQIICPNQNCNFKGVGKAVGGKSLIVLLLLLCFFLVPGIIYLFWPIQQQVICPQCGMRVR